MNINKILDRLWEGTRCEVRRMGYGGTYTVQRACMLCDLDVERYDVVVVKYELLNDKLILEVR